MQRLLILSPFALLMALQPNAALAYIGPGLGVGAITAVFGVLAAIVMAFAALLWYPVKRLLKSRREAPTENAQ